MRPRNFKMVLASVFFGSTGALIGSVPLSTPLIEGNLAAVFWMLPQVLAAIAIFNGLMAAIFFIEVDEPLPMQQVEPSEAPAGPQLRPRDDHRRAA